MSASLREIQSRKCIKYLQSLGRRAMVDMNLRNTSVTRAYLRILLLPKLRENRDCRLRWIGQRSIYKYQAPFIPRTYTFSFKATVTEWPLKAALFCQQLTPLRSRVWMESVPSLFGFDIYRSRVILLLLLPLLLRMNVVVKHSPKM